MDVVTLARLQFAATCVYHFFFVPLTLGLGLLVAVMETLYVTRGDETYKRMTKFWGKLFLINFAMGVVTGIVMEFQFGMNWSEYTRFVGDIFGAPLAIEALLAFFLESTFIGMWVFGWEKLSQRAHLAAIWLVALGANISALWILIANSFMQQPVGYVLRNGRAEMTDIFALMTNPFVRLQFLHVFAAGLTTGAFFMMGISAYHLLRRTNPGVFQRSLRIGAVAGLMGTVLVAGIGHAQGQHLLAVQPMKMAAAEALYENADPAGLSLFAVVDEAQRKELISIRAPYVLSILGYNSPSGMVRGINSLEAEFIQKYGPGNYVPILVLPYWGFRAMVGAGLLMMALSLWGLVLTFGQKQVEKLPAGLKSFFSLEAVQNQRPILLKALVLTIGLPYLATTTGWLLAEVGRWPWVVYGVMRIEKAVSPNVTAGMLLTSLIGFVLIYGALMVADVYLLGKYAKAGLPAEEK
jgi:cytochrome d ubiquinol oxidase subunit I